MLHILVSRALRIYPFVCTVFHFDPRSRRQCALCQQLRFGFDLMDEIQRQQWYPPNTTKQNNNVFKLHQLIPVQLMIGYVSYPSLSDFMALLATLPFPHGNNLIRRIVNGHKHRAAVCPAKA